MTGETVAISRARASALDRVAAAVGMTRAGALEAILDAEFIDGVPQVARKLQARRDRARAASVKISDIRHCVENEALGVEAAAKKLGVSKATVSRRLRRFGIEPAGRKYEAPRSAEVIEAVRQGFSTAPEIASHVGISRNVALQVLLRLEGSAVRRRPGTDSRGQGGRPPIRWRLVEAAE